jgi:hypothetical protein
MPKLLMFFFLLAFMLSYSEAQPEDTRTLPATPGQRPIVYVMPNALVGPGSSDNSQIIEGSSHDGKEPQVAMIYKELQHRRECRPFTENIIKDKANYFFLLQHGGGKGNRWVVSDPNGNVIASGESLMLGNSVKDACVAMDKDWQQRSPAAK